MNGRRFPRLEAIFGAPLGEVGAEEVVRAIEDKVRENDQLDWKRTYPERTPDGRAELAKDVCALANHQGGVLVYGVADKNDAAEKAMPVDVSDQQQRHVREVLASNAAPMPRVDLKAIDSGNGEGFLLVVVEPSPNAPHAVSPSSGTTLAYPIRDGTGTRYLSESEVADAYGRRLERASERASRLRTILDEGAVGLNPDDPWLVLATVPAVPGRMELGYERVDQLRGWLQAVQQPRIRSRQLTFRQYHATVGVRRVAFTDDEQPRWSYAELHADGASFLAIQMVQRSRFERGETPVVWTVSEEGLLEDTVGMVEVACRHAVENAGTWGEATSILTLSDEGVVGSLTRETHLFHTRPGYSHIEGRAIRNAPTIPHTIPLDAGMVGRELLSAARLLATDLLQAFGIPEVRQVDTAGRLRPGYFKPSRDVRESLARWAERNGVELSERNVR